MKKNKAVLPARGCSLNPYWRRYDFEICDGLGELKDVLNKINANGYVIAAVTQHEHTYTVIFKRFD